MNDPTLNLLRLDRQIGDCERHIAEQRMRLRWAGQRRLDTADSERLLANLVASLVALRHFRKLVQKEVRPAPTHSESDASNVKSISEAADRRARANLTAVQPERGSSGPRLQ